jgi:N-acyl-D-amino-acid deacylase
MTTTYDLIVRNGQILDGSGNPQFTGDVAIDAGIIQAVGMVSGRGREEIDHRVVIARDPGPLP